MFKKFFLSEKNNQVTKEGGPLKLKRMSINFNRLLSESWN